MKTYNTQAEIEADIENNVLAVNESVVFECNFAIPAAIYVLGDITARDITARDINALNITARDINAGNIDALNINARTITYYAFCCVCNSITCDSIKATRDKHCDPICIDGALKIKEA